MPRPGLRSKTQLRKNIKTPGNRNVVHYWRKKPTKSICSICKKPLQSVPRLKPSEMKKTPITSRRVNRINSGRYCSKCLQNLIRNAAWHS